MPPPHLPFPVRQPTRPCPVQLRYLCTVGTATVLHIDLRPQGQSELAALAWLDAEERERWRTYLHLGARRRFALCRAALRYVLCAQLACQNERLAFRTAQHGKPHARIDAVPAPFSFNLSHSGRHGLLAVAPAGQLGVDVEAHDEVSRYLARLSVSQTVFTAPERAALARSGSDDRVRLFAKLWTIKEALGKARGTGLRGGLAALAIPATLLQGTRTVWQFPHHSGMRWRVECVGNAEFAATVVQEIVNTPAPSAQNSGRYHMACLATPHD